MKHLERNPILTGRNRQVSHWLLIVAAMVFAMIIIGGLTRLTHSGLSMVEWRPLTGWLPPLTDAQWLATFESYKQFPEYQINNSGMNLVEFKEIFWLEYIHRVWGRLIGVAFLVPFVVFLLKGWLGRRLIPPLAVLFMLGGLQGALGWYMVESGLIDQPDVSQFRLVAHLAAALALYSALLWIAFRLRWPATSDETPAIPRVWWSNIVVCGLIMTTIIAGGFVAGIDAGFAYNTFPLMNGELLPRELFALRPWYRNLFEDVTTVQFVHRLLALTTLAAIVVFRLMLLGRCISARAVRAASWLCVWALVQMTLGVATLVLVVPVPLASAHQAGAIILWSLALWMTYELGTRQPITAASGSGAAEGYRAVA